MISGLNKPTNAQVYVQLIGAGGSHPKSNFVGTETWKMLYTFSLVGVASKKCFEAQ